MSKRFSQLRVCVAAAALFAGAAASHAVVISSSSSNPYSFSWSYNTPTVTPHVLSGTGSMMISGFNSSVLTVSISLSNTSLIGGQGGERLTSFGFGIEPNASWALFLDNPLDGGLVGAGLGRSIPSLQGVEVCAFSGNNCAGGGNGGIRGGSSDSFAILLGGNWGSSVNIEPIGFKYQTGYGSFEFTTSTSTSSGNTPEPSTASLALLGLGLLGAGFALRRRKTS